MRGYLLATALLAWMACGGGTPTAETATKFFAVQPVVRQSGAPAATGGMQPGGELSIRQGQAFSYALPPGWHVGEDGQFALTLAAADNKAITILVGNAGMPPNTDPSQFVSQKLMAMRLENLQLSQARQAKPIAGFAQAVEFDVTYSVGGVACRGVAKCHIAPAYDTTPWP